jgi:hypothetical protein
MHYKQFGISEYERNTWVDRLRDQSPYLLFGGIFIAIAIIYYIATNVSSQNAQNASLPLPMPQAGGWLKRFFK